MLTMLVGMVCAAAVDAASPTTPEYTYGLDDQGLAVTAPDGTSYSVSMPCSGRALARSADRLLVACGDDGLVIFSLETPSTPQLVGVRDLGEVTGFLRHEGQLWAQITRIDARLVTGVLTAPESTTRVAALPTTPAPAGPLERAPLAPVDAVGRVVVSRAGSVVIDLGGNAGVERGERVALFREEAIPLAADEIGIQQVLLAVGEVTSVAARHAEVQLGRNERVPQGALARITRAPKTASLYSPPRIV
ncbi:MAG: hypothetical protein AAB426_07790, partial [Myxococcota bacterium]